MLDNDFEEEWDRFKCNSVQKHYKPGEIKLIARWFFQRGRLTEALRQVGLQSQNKKKK